MKTLDNECILYEGFIGLSDIDKTPLLERKLKGIFKDTGRPTLISSDGGSIEFFCIVFINRKSKLIDDILIEFFDKYKKDIDVSKIEKRYMTVPTLIRAYLRK
jgi:hypothetical protein